MADPAMRPPGPRPGGAPMPGGPPGGDRSSLLNPNDMAMKSAAGKIRPDMSVRELLGEMGIDVDGPVTQLSGAMRKQLTNATIPGKLSGGGGPPRPRAGGAPSGMGGMPSQPAGGGLDQLLGGR